MAQVFKNPDQQSDELIRKPFSYSLVESNDDILDDDYVLFDDLGTIKGTKGKNYKAQIQDALAIQDYNDFKDYDEIIAYMNQYPSYFKSANNIKAIKRK